MNIAGTLTIGVAAHRDLVESEIPGLEVHLSKFFQGLQADLPGLDIRLITQLAEGGDQLAARLALDSGFDLVTVLPMPQQHYESDFSSSEAIDDFRSLLDRSEQVIELPLESLSEDLDRVSRDRQYARAGIFTSNHCQVLLAIWDGREATHLGGTASVLHYHLTGVMEGLDDEEAPTSLLADDESELAFHIVCSRNRVGGEPLSPLKSLQSGWMTMPFSATRTEQMPDSFRIMLARLQEFHEDRAKYRQAINSDTHSLLGDIPGLPLPDGIAVVDHLYQSADWLAIVYQKRVNRILMGTYSLAVLMGLVFILYSENVGPDYLVLVFVAIFFCSIGVQRIADWRQWHRKYLDYRALAEGLRVQLYWSLAGVVETRSAEFAYTNFLQKQDVELGWIRHVMRSASLARSRRHAPEKVWVDWVIERWIGPGERVPQQEIQGGQLAYYSRKRSLNAANYKMTSRLGNVSLWSGIGIAVILAIISSQIEGTVRTLLLILMGMLPLIAGVRDAYSHKKAEKELIKQYDYMARVFDNARRMLADSTDLQFRRRVLRALGQAALEEGAEWILMHRERPLEHSRL